LQGRTLPALFVDTIKRQERWSLRCGGSCKSWRSGRSEDRAGIVCGGPNLEWRSMPPHRRAALRSRSKRYRRFLSRGLHNRHRWRAVLDHGTQERSSEKRSGLHERSDIKGVQRSRVRLQHEFYRIPELSWRRTQRVPVDAAQSDRNLDQGNKNPAQAKLGRGTLLYFGWTRTSDPCGLAKS
jgi:hypothetical protein